MNKSFQLATMYCLLLAKFTFAQLGPVEIPVVTIAEARSLPPGTLVALEGVTLTSELDTVEISFFHNFRIEDESAAITVFGDSFILSPDLSALEPGDVIDVTGVTACFAGLAQINQLDDPLNFSVTDTGSDTTVNAPIGVSAADFMDLSSTAEAFESKLVSLNNVTFLGESNPSGPGEPFAAVANYVVTDGSNNVDVRVATSSIASQLGNVPVGPARIVGTFNQFGDCDPGTSGYQLLAFEVLVLGDTDGNGVANLLDVARFVDALSQGNFVAEADINGDGLVNLVDVAPFVDLLSN